jgi:ATP-dependent protease ClpP protease subunit
MFRLEKLSDKAILTIYGYVGGAYLDFRAVENALHDIKASGLKQVDFWCHTYGGDVFEGNLMITFIHEFRKAGGVVDLYAPGIVASMGMPLAMACNERYIADNGFGMIHAPRGGAYGTAKDMEQTANLLRLIEKRFKKDLNQISNKSEKEITEWMDGTDYWYDADELIDMGLFDDKIPSTVTDITTLDKEEIETLGAKGVFERFAALTIPETKNQNNLKMDKKILIARYGLTTVTDANTEEEVMAAVDAKIKASNDRAKAAEDKQKETEKKSIEAAVKAASKAGKIPEAKEEEYIARGEKIGLEELNAIFADMQVYETITDKLDGEQSGGSGSQANADRKNWDWDKWQAEAEKNKTVKAEFEAMPKKDSKAFTALYKAKFDTEPEL